MYNNLTTSLNVHLILNASLHYRKTNDQGITSIL